MLCILCISDAIAGPSWQSASRQGPRSHHLSQHLFDSGLVFAQLRLEGVSGIVFSRGSLLCFQKLYFWGKICTRDLAAWFVQVILISLLRDSMSICILCRLRVNHKIYSRRWKAGRFSMAARITYSSCHILNMVKIGSLQGLQCRRRWDTHPACQHPFLRTQED